MTLLSGIPTPVSSLCHMPHWVPACYLPPGSSLLLWTALSHRPYLLWLSCPLSRGYPSHIGHWTLFPCGSPFPRQSTPSSFSHSSRDSLILGTSLAMGISTTGMVGQCSDGVQQPPAPPITAGGERASGEESNRGGLPWPGQLPVLRKGWATVPALLGPPCSVSKPSAGCPRRAPRLQSLYE